MSRLARKPIIIPNGVECSPEKTGWRFKGAKGEAYYESAPPISISKKDSALIVFLDEKISEDLKHSRIMLGTVASQLRNVVMGVSAGFEKKLELEGVGYKVQLEGKDLVLSLGFTHPVRYIAPQGIVFAVEKNVIIVRGSDKALVGKVAAEIHDLKPPEPYKGKGIHYLGEVIKRKAGKKAVGTT